MFTSQLPSLYKFWRLLRNHDWTFEYSDDSSVWRRGSAELKKIRDIVSLGGKEYESLFNEYSKYAWRKDNSIQEPTRPARTINEQNEDVEMLSNLADTLELNRDEIFSIESDQVSSATELWKLINPLQSMLHHIRNIVEDKEKSPMWNSVAFREYKKIKKALETL